MKQLKTRELLYDGTEGESLYGESHYFFGNSFEIKDILRYEFARLKRKIENEAYEKIISDAGFTSVSSFFKHLEETGEVQYRSQNGLPLYYVTYLHMLFVFSFGETQPARYQLYCEGVWEMYVNRWEDTP
ncbi:MULTISPECIES: hypothetical protein [Flavobacterium]|uniref:hypothetical protein n=1 Tax=Flavobacterium TaxID=237 RepID=UPI000962667F|nr:MULTISPECIES: hypothetical protein [Flavobacterium]MBN9283762.1 hypothetical protein [Flavobacterium sp.]OJV68733.1 MAG: hypothetical protein BGO42_02565 [Flavobacterium sp. 40-81]